MAKVITIKRGDTKPIFKDIPLIDGQPIPFTGMAGCTVKFILKGGLVNVKKPGEIVSVTVNSIAVAQFQYQPVDEDVAQVAPKCKQEWELTSGDGRILSFPNGGYNLVKIIADLG